ncbi:MAG: glycosyltransferase family 39 protein, partial [Bacteroidota bacterium]
MDLPGSSKRWTVFDRLGDVSPWYFIIFWIGLNLVQAFFTDVHNDESYYWLYTKQLQWGYYDHPPMVAIWIKAGMALFPEELGLRFFHVLSFGASLLIWLRWARREHHIYFYLLLFSAPFVNYLSFMVFPDGPLLFFFSAFAWAYLSYHQQRSARYLIFMSLGLAGMLYSKYHGVLVFPLLLLAQRKAFGELWPYLVAALALFLYVPHLWWQYQNGFPSFQFHLTGRATAFDWEDPMSFLLQQSLSVGPALFMAFA